MKAKIYIETTIPSYLAAHYLYPGRVIGGGIMDENIDPIVAEVRKAREAYAKKFNYDVKAMCSDLKKRQAQNTKKVISLPPKRIKPLDSI
jgi:hypothetical protein